MLNDIVLCEILYIFEILTIYTRGETIRFFDSLIALSTFAPISVDIRCRRRQRHLLFEITMTVHLISRTTTKWYEYDFIAKEGRFPGPGVWGFKAERLESFNE